MHDHVGNHGNSTCACAFRLGFPDDLYINRNAKRQLALSTTVCWLKPNRAVTFAENVHEICDDRSLQDFIDGIELRIYSLVRLICKFTKLCIIVYIYSVL